MTPVGYYEGATWVHRLDPRTRICAAMALAAGISLAVSPGVLAAGLAAGAGLVLCARLPARRLGARMLRINLLLAVVAVTLPLQAKAASHAGFAENTFGMTAAGPWLLALTLKANAIVLAVSALMGTIEPFMLARALRLLRVPRTLTHLLWFTMRYVTLLSDEYRALLRAMKARAFRPRANRHTYRTYASLIGMLLVRSLDRAERVVGAMRCRGFRGEFPAFHPMAMTSRDLRFSVAAALVLLAMAAVEITARRGMP